MKFWLQKQARAGNWVDRMGTDDIHSAISQLRYSEANCPNDQFRVVMRDDKVVYPHSYPTKHQLADLMAAENFSAVGHLRGDEMSDDELIEAMREACLNAAMPADASIDECGQIAMRAVLAVVRAHDMDVGVRDV